MCQPLAGLRQTTCPASHSCLLQGASWPRGQGWLPQNIWQPVNLILTRLGGAEESWGELAVTSFRKQL